MDFNQARRQRRPGLRAFSAFLLLVAAVTVVLPTPSRAQDVLRIAAIINEDIISVYDLMNRVRLVILSTGLENSAEMQQRLAPQVLRSLIDERLQLQEAKRLNITATEEEVANTIRNIEKDNNMPPGGLRETLARAGLDMTSLEQQLKARIAWVKVVRRNLRHQIDIGEEEIDEELRRLQTLRDEPQNRIAEIFLAVNNPEEDAQVRRAAERLVQQIQRGARFDALAREFSQSATAAVGGDLGWVAQGQLEEPIEQAIAEVPPGSVVGPVRTLSGYHVLLVIDRRIPGKSSPGNTIVDLRQLVVPVAAQAGKNELRQQLRLAEEIRSTVKTCEEMTERAKSLGIPPARIGGEIMASKLPPRIQPAVMQIEIGQVSEPIRTRDGLAMFMVCGRKSAQDPVLPTRKEIADRLLNERLDLRAQRYMRDLRQAAFVDIRI